MVEKFRNLHWNYYLLLEEDLIQTLRFVQLSKDNFNVFSIEYVKQFQSVCAEIDVLLKYLCKFNCLSSSPKNIKEYAENILGNYPTFTKESVFVMGLEEELSPWEEWQLKNDKEEYKSPKWWSEYNDVKHGRVSMEDESNNYKKANLQNVLYAISALFVLCEYINRELCAKENRPHEKQIKQSKLFTMKNWEYSIIYLSSDIRYEI